ncbi:MAG: cyclic nucleotide-binding domain-containing protein [Betaproteobacteria bacterium]
MDPAPAHPDSGVLNQASSRFYDPAVARGFFESGGQFEELSAGSKIFSEGDTVDKRGLFSKSKPHRMYLLTEGEVALTAKGKLIDTIHPGGVFGEMAVISETPGSAGVPRTAAATARIASKAYSLDVQETETALQRTPGFALMLMSVMFERLRFLAARLATRPDSAGHHSNKSEPIFDLATLASLREKLAHSTVMSFPEGVKIMVEGATGSAMYIVLDGKVAVAIGRKIVEKLGPGGVFGEMALVDNSPRTATAVARSDCELLAIDRDTLIKLVKAEPAVGMQMMRAVAARIRYMNELLA